MFSYGTNFRITIYGASHEDTMGIIIDGINPGTIINVDDINKALDSRRPSQVGTTPRVEEDKFNILNGFYNGYTTGAPLHIVIQNNNVKSKDYESLKNHPRPNHADYVSNIKYNGFNDPRGGGIFSGRLTTLFVIAGAIAKSIITPVITSNLIQVGKLEDLTKLDEYLTKITENKDSVGGIVELKTTNMLVGIGDPYFKKLDAAIAHLIMSVPGVRGIVFGDKFDVTNLGSINNDVIIDSSGTTKTNHSGGIVGGISNGNDIVFKVFVKPTSSIGIKQDTYNFKDNKVSDLIIEGRHDAAFIRRIPIVLESMLAIVLADYLNK